MGVCWRREYYSGSQSHCCQERDRVQTLSSNNKVLPAVSRNAFCSCGFSPYSHLVENTYPAFEGPDRTDRVCLTISGRDPGVQTVEVRKGGGGQVDVI
ncbi:hypothetical protein Tco_0146564 [Tanacetum coccineum]